MGVAMGFFNDLKQTLAESPGRVSKIFLNDYLQAATCMSESMRAQILAGYCEKRESMLPRLSNMTVEGVLKAARNFQIAGNKLKDSTPTEGYPLLLVGIWLECACRPGIDAATVHQYLDDLAVSNGGTFLS